RLPGRLQVAPGVAALDGTTAEAEPVEVTFVTWAPPWPQLLVLIGLALLVYAVIGGRRHGRRRLDSLLAQAREEGRRSARPTASAETSTDPATSAPAAAREPSEPDGKERARNADRPGPSLPDPSSAITDRGHARTRKSMMTTKSPRSLLRSAGAAAGAALLAATLAPLGAAPALADDPAETQLEATTRSGEDVLTGRSAAAVQPLPGEQGEDEAYVWAFFTGEGVGGEEISLAASRGNDALSWNTLNDGEPLFESEFGEEGL